MPPRLLGIAAAAAGLVLLLVLAAGVALVRSRQRGGENDASRAALPQPASRQADVGAPLPFDDQFSGTIAQRRGAGGTTVTLHLSGTGQQAVQLDISLLVNQGGGGGSQVQSNQAVLRDAAGAPLCQGGLLSLDASGFSAQCRGVGVYAGRGLQLQGTITTLTGTQLQGELQVSAASG